MTMAHWEWAKPKCNAVLMENTKGIAVELDGKTIAVCVLDTWSYTSVQLHIAIENPICLKNGRFQREIFGYIFDTAGREMALGLVPEDNEKALNFDKKIGFKEISRIENGYNDGIDMIILQLKKEDYEAA